MASELTKPFEEKMKKTLTALDSDYGTIRAGRANPHVLASSAADSALGCIPAEGN